MTQDTNKTVNTRKRGRILTEQGLAKWDEALKRDKEFDYDGTEPDFQKIADFVQITLDKAKQIWRRQEGVDVKFILAIGKSFNLQLKEVKDYCFKQNGQPNSSDDLTTEENIEFDSLTRWVGRKKLITDLIQNLQSNTRILSIVGLTGIGKTTLAQKLGQEPTLRNRLNELKYVTYYGKEDSGFEIVADAVLGDSWRQEPELHRDKDQLVTAMTNYLQNHSCLLIIDMIEVVLEPDGKKGHQFKDDRFYQFLREILITDKITSRIILTSQDRPPALAEGRYMEQIKTQILRGLEDTEALELFKVWDVSTESAEAETYLRRIIQVYEGHPLALRAIAGEARQFPYDGDIVAYWHDYIGKEIEEAEKIKEKTDGDPSQDRLNLMPTTILQELVRSRLDKTFERLKIAYPIAHRMLCAGSVYRRPEERMAWLYQIDQYPEDEQKAAFEILKNRFFLETEKKENKVLYRLHGLMRAIALEGWRKLCREQN